jgi:hypothetical protein
MFLIALLIFISLTFISSVTLATDTSVIVDQEVELEQGWVEVNEENENEMVKKYVFLKQMGNYDVVLIKDSTYSKFIKAQEEKNYDNIVNYYPAYIFVEINDISDFEETDEEILESISESVKKRTKAAYKNGNLSFSPDEKIILNNNPGIKVHYTLGHLEGYNIGYIIDDKLVSLTANYATKQKANKEVHNILDQLIDG